MSTGDGAFSINASVMIGAKEGRKRAENDLQLVANRIALLRYEEQVDMILGCISSVCLVYCNNFYVFICFVSELLKKLLKRKQEHKKF